MYVRNVCLCMFVMPVCANQFHSGGPKRLIWFQSWRVVKCAERSACGGHQLRPSLITRKNHSFLPPKPQCKTTSLTSLTPAVAAVADLSRSATISFKEFLILARRTREAGSATRDCFCSPFFVTRKLWRIIGT